MLAGCSCGCFLVLSCAHARALQAQLLAEAERVFFEESEEGEASTRLCEALLPAAALHLVVTAGVCAPAPSNRCRYQLTRLVWLTRRPQRRCIHAPMLASVVWLQCDIPAASPCSGGLFGCTCLGGL